MSRPLHALHYFPPLSLFLHLTFLSNLNPSPSIHPRVLLSWCVHHRVRERTLLHHPYSLAENTHSREETLYVGSPEMSFSGQKTWVLPLLMVISFLHILDSGQTKVGAIRILPQHMEAPSPEKSHTEIFRQYFNGRVSSNLNSTGNGSFFDSKRRIPSCPDPLHN